MKKALVLFWHGLGDVILLSPHLRHLYQNGYMIDIMCREAVTTSHLLDSCPYIDKLVTVENPWEHDFDLSVARNFKRFYEIGGRYDKILAAPHFSQLGYKIDFTSYELGIKLEDKKTEVFIPEDVQSRADKICEANYPDGFIFQHTDIEFHEYHTWNASKFIEDRLPDLPVYKSCREFEDINMTFAIMKNATHIVLSSSVMVHAAEAMGCIIDVINYGKPDRKVWPLDQDLVVRIREEGEWIQDPKINLEFIDEMGIDYFDVRHQRVINEITDYDSILEVGPGFGAMAYYMRDFDYSMLDITDAKLLDYRNAGGDARLYIHSGSEDNFSEGQFECVLASSVVEHIEDYQDAVNNFIRWASKKVVIVVPAGDSYWALDHKQVFTKKDFEFIEYPYTIERIVTKEADYESGQRCYFIVIDKESK